MKDGVLIIDKPKGITSHDVVAMVRKTLHTKKVGHTGTLDPLATGVLVVCVGEATKLVQYLTCDEKIYDVEMKLGIKTDTGDITGNIIIEDAYNEIPNFDTLKLFIGKQKQIPPMYSAIKIDGVKLYEFARKGIEVEREARDIEIFDISNSLYDDGKLKFRVHCSKGTYIRVLCEDIAEKLGTVGTMTSLRRIKSGKFDINDSITVDEISENKILGIEKLYENKIDVTDNIKKIINGMTLKCDLDDGLYSLYYNSQYIGIGEIRNKELKRKIILSDAVEMIEKV